jgi:hypothetical protein
MDTRDDGVEERRDQARDDQSVGSVNGQSADAANGRSADSANGQSADSAAVGSPGAAPSDDDATTLEAQFDDADRELGPLEPGSPTVENALFVVLGAVATVLLFVTAL